MNALDFDWKAYWHRMFNSKKYLKNLLKRQKTTIDIYYYELNKIQKLIEEKGLQNEDLFKDIYYSCARANGQHENHSLNFVPDDIDKR